MDDLKQKGLNIEEGPNTEIDLKKLAAGRLAAVAALEMTGDYYLMASSKLNANLEKVKPLIVEKPYYFMVSHQLYKKDKKMAERIFNAIAEIRDDPNFKKKLKNYLK